MAHNRRSSNRAGHGQDMLRAPSALSLIGRIASALVVDGLFLLIAIIAVASYLYVTGLRNDVLIAVCFVILGLLALLRGCHSWQQDLTHYQRQLAMLRHRESLQSNGSRTVAFRDTGRDRY